MKKSTLRIEGWRDISHSYAIVNQWQILSLLKDERLSLLHEDRPFYREDWQKNTSLWPQDLHEKIQSLPHGETADIVLRMDFPHRFDPAPAEKLFVFMSCEYDRLPGRNLAVSEPLAAQMERSSAHILTPSSWSKQALVRSGAAAEKVHVVPHGFAPDVFFPITSEDKCRLRAALGLAEDQFYFFHAGAMTDNKGMDLLLRAFAAVLEKKPEARLILKGGDHLFQSEGLLMSTMELLEDEGYDLPAIMARFIYIGQELDFRKMADLYCAADVYVAPYRAEGFNLPVLEAAACGLPVICTKGGSTDDFTDPSFALHIPSEKDFYANGLGYLEPSLEVLTTHMLASMDVGLRKQAHKAGPKFVSERFTWDLVSRHLADLILG